MSKNEIKKKRKDIRKETAKQREAFKYWANLKTNFEESPFEKTAEHFGLKIGTVYNYSNRLDWKGRYADLEEKAKERSRRELERKIMKRQTGFLESIMAQMKQTEESEMPIPDDGLAYVKVQAELLKMFQLLTGQATERTESNVVTKVDLSIEEREMLENLSADIVSMIQNEGELIDEFIESDSNE